MRGLLKRKRKQKKPVFKYKLLTVSGKTIKLKLNSNLIEKMHNIEKFNGIHLSDIFVINSDRTEAIMINNIVRIKLL